jgi:hypothetical protein
VENGECPRPRREQVCETIASDEGLLRRLVRDLRRHVTAKPSRPDMGRTARRQVSAQRSARSEVKVICHS